jgi:sensor histidine kinase regulating citrate/malate metabolism
MGFGLYWAKDYVEGIGGNIEVDSVWGQGTIFYIRVPAITE